LRTDITTPRVRLHDADVILVKFGDGGMSCDSPMPVVEVTEL